MNQEPIFEDYSQLVGRKDEFGHSSEKGNPFCRIATEGCSEAMKNSDLCFWHYHRMGPVEEHTCGCPDKKWKTATSDRIGRLMVQKYYHDEKIGCYDYSEKLYCCLNSCMTGGRYQCGPMVVCDACKDLHPPAELRALKESDHPV